MLDAIKRFFGWGVHAPEGRPISDDILWTLNRDYPPAIVGDTALFPNLPRGAMTRIAFDLGCSRGYVSRVARRIGYHVEGTP
jgi:hypothetical protein